MAQAVLDKNNIAISAGDLSVYNYDEVTREYFASTVEYMAVGVGIPANACIDAPPDSKSGFAVCRTASLDKWDYVTDHRDETVYETETGLAVTVDYLGAIRNGFTTAAPATPYDAWNGSKWVTDTSAQHDADIAAAEEKRQQLIDTAMASISLLQLKLQAGRKLTEAEVSRLNVVLDYIDLVAAINAGIAPDINWPESPLSN
ncbi:TPA: tail fiber assembly protein [Yersinia enterocolitica]|nr:tail fiber assembly protein [Yersinia enterocolitica]